MQFRKILVLGLSGMTLVDPGLQNTELSTYTVAQGSQTNGVAPESSFCLFPGRSSEVADNRRANTTDNTILDLNYTFRSIHMYGYTDSNS